MKKYLIALGIIILAILASNFYARRAAAPDIEIEPTVSRPDPRGATFLFENGPITLKSGTASTSLAPGSAFTQDITLLELRAYGDLNLDDKNDTAVILVESGGGSGLFVYVAAYLSGNVTYKGSNAVFLGDRISPTALKIENNVLAVTYLDRRADEPMAAEPTVTRTARYVIRNGTLEER